MGKNKKLKIVIQNRRSKYDFSIKDYYEAGLVLLGTEVKSLRMGKASLKDAYVQINNGEFFVKSFKISEYPFAYADNHNPDRLKKILLHKDEIKKISGKINEKGYSLIPIKVYFDRGKAKALLGLAKGKRSYDKRESIKRRDQKRDFERQRKIYI